MAETERQERRLSAILSADVVGYSAMMNRDESGTLRRLMTMRQDVMVPRIDRHNGRVIDHIGDGTLLAFDSAVDAVTFAVDFQHAVMAGQATVPDNERFQYRVGINVGDVIVDGSSIYGDGVNITARIEALADPGGICITRTVLDQIGGKLELDVTPTGSHEVKNIPTPIEVFKVELNDASTRLATNAEATPAAVPPPPPKNRNRIALAAIAAVLLVGAMAAAFWTQRTPPAGHPVIAVLPLQDSSPEPHRGLLSDPISDGILAHLARYPELKVIARGSSFRFRDADRDLREIGAQLNANYIVEGSLHFDGERITVNAALVDVGENTQAWSDRMTADISDLGDVISVIGQRVAYQIEDFVGDVRIETIPDGSADALLLVMRGRKLSMTGPSRENNAAVIAVNQDAIDRFPDSAWGHLGLAFALRTKVRFGWAEDPNAVLMQAATHAETAVRLAPQNYSAHFALGRVRMQQGDMTRSIQALQTALKLNPSSADTMNALAQAHLYLGENDKALEVLATAKQIDPLPTFVHIWIKAWVLWQDNQCEAAQATFVELNSPPPLSQKLASAIQICLGNEAAAQDAMAAFLKTSPTWTVEKERAIQKDVWTYEPGLTRWLEDLKAAGLPVSESG